MSYRIKRCYKYLVRSICGVFILQHTILYSAIPFPKDLSQLIIENWTVNEGLPGNHIKQISKTPDGYLWLTTSSGLVRYDGNDFFTLNESNSCLTSENLGPLKTDNAGTLWIGSHGNGIIQFKDNTFTYYVAEDELANDILSIDIDGHDQVWVMTRAGLYHLKEGKLQKKLLPNSTRWGEPIALAPDNSGNMWAYLAKGILYNIANGDTIDTGYSYYSRAYRIWVSWDFVFDNSDNWWLATPEGLLHGYEDGEIQFVTTTESKGGEYNVIRSITTSNDGNILIGTYEGLFRISTDYKVESVMLSGRMRGILQDNENNIWLGSYAGGLYKLSEGPFELLGRGQGIHSDRVWAVIEDSNRNFWVATENGLFIQKKDTVINVQELRGQPIRSLSEDKHGRIWIGTDGQGIYMHANGKISPLNNAYFQGNSSTLKVIYEDPLMDGITWVGTQTSLVRLKDYKVDTAYNFGFVYALSRDKAGTLWCTSETGIHQFKSSRYSHFTSKTGLPTNRIIDILEDEENDRIWFGSDGGGLLSWKNNTFTAYRRKDGLNTNDVWGIAKDSFGNLWLSCDEGLRKVSIASINAYDNGLISTLQVTNYGKKTNKSIIEFNSLGFPLKYVTDLGIIWFPSVNGAVKIDPSFQSQNLPPQLKIERVLSRDEDHKFSSKVYLRKDNRDVEFKYSATYFGSHQEINYQYWLEGYDEDWKEVGGRTSAFYTNLPPGQFTFRVRIGGPWNHIEDSQIITIPSYFYETYWFYMISALSLFFSIYLLFRIRINSMHHRNSNLALLNNQMVKANKELEQKNAEMERFNYTVSHDLKSPLITIKGFLGLLALDIQKEDKEAIRNDMEFIDKAATNMDNLLRELLELSKIGRVINEPQNCQMHEIVDDVMKNLTIKTSDNVDLIIQEDLPSIYCDKLRMMEVIQNLIENAIKFGRAAQKRVEIGSQPGSEGFTTFFVKDNGIGINEEYLEKIFLIFERLDSKIEGTGIGLAIIKRIIEVHGGKIWAESKGVGTTFFFTVPAQKV